MRFILATLMALMIGSASPARAEGPTNIALHKPYVLSVAPNYALCTDEGDATDLTDGVYPKPPEGSALWGQKGCVGWNHARKLIFITIDLGKIEPIGGASFSSAAGGAGVSYPRSLAISVSQDGKMFHTVGDLTVLDESNPPAAYGEYSTHIYRTSKLRTKGRYVRIAAVPSAVFLFVDEIEIYRGSDDLLKQPMGGKMLSDEQLIDPLRLTQLGVHHRLRSDWHQVQAAVQSQAPASVKSQLLKDLDALASQLEPESYPRSLKGFKAIVPVGELDAKILAVYGQLQAARGLAPMTLWHSRPYQLLDLFAKPSGSVKELTVRMMGNEHRAEAFNLTNASAETKQVRFTVEGMPKGALEVSQVEYVDTREGRPVASALVGLETKEGHYTTLVPAGMTRQIWLSFDSKEIPAGTHSGQIKLSADSFDQTIALKLDVAAARMADAPALSTSFFDYIYDKMYGIVAGNQRAAAKDMPSHLIDAPWGSSQAVPFPKPADFDAQGNLTGKIDYSKWDAFVKFWPGMRHYLVFAALNPTSSFAGLQPGTPVCDRALSQWSADWAKHNQSLGLKPKQAMILFIDEPSREWFEACYKLIRPFTEGSREVGVFIDPGIHSVEDFEAARPTLELCDIIMPTLAAYYTAGPKVQALYQQLQEQGRQLGLYMCNGPVLHFDPSYYRLQPWSCYAIGATSSSYWAYGDNGGVADCWNEYTAVGATSYTPVYLTPTGVSGSKHWEALREGIEDYQYLTMLADKGATKLAQDLMEQVIKQNTLYYASNGWKDDSRFAEMQRLRILEKLAEK